MGENEDFGIQFQCVWGFPHTKKFSGTISVSNNSNQFCHYLPGDSITSHRLRFQSYKTVLTQPTQLRLPVTSPGGYLCFWPTRGGNSSLLGFDSFARAAPRAQRNILLTRLLVYYKRISLRNSQIEGRHKAKYGERAWSFWIPFPDLCVHQPGSSLKAVLLGFYGGFIT